MSKGSSAVLTKLRALMRNPTYVSQPLDAYIIPTGDAHQSEYVAACDTRRVFITGFTGSAGTAVVTAKKAALWTDGRYYLQAEQQLSDDWQLMKEGLPSTPCKAKWLNEVLPVGGRVGCDPSLLSFFDWKSLVKDLRQEGRELVGVDHNLVDPLWQDRPDPPNSPLLILSTKETGWSWQEKVDRLRRKMLEDKISALVLTALDEVAWLLNLRGSDIAYNPVFMSYVIVTLRDTYLFIDEQKVTDAVRKHLVNVQIHPYTEVFKFLSSLAEHDDVSHVWISDKSSYAIIRQVPKPKQHLYQSPVAVMKCAKTKAEMKGMELAQVKDAVALCEFFCWLEEEVHTGTVTEISAADKAEEFRSKQKNYISLSFDTISSIGAHGAIIHYKPTQESSQPVTSEEIYLIDSGAQYREGTTDTTRTVHLGNPTKYEQECFTRVLKGNINLSSAIFPNGVKGHMLDTLARAPLWEAGLDYRHGTGHGVGAFLNVHEGPCGISYKTSSAEIPLEEHMVLSDEPGYYEAGNFGIRIENCVKVVKAETPNNFEKKGFLTFEPITLVPIQKKMIEPSLLTEKEINWLNDYHSKVRHLVGKELKQQGKKQVYAWLVRATEPLG